MAQNEPLHILMPQARLRYSFFCVRLGETIVCPEHHFETAEQLLQKGRIEEAIAVYEAAELAGYDADACSGARWICHMLLGDFQRAWVESDAIQKRGQPDAHRFWDGQPFEGRRVLIRCLHGLGDTIQFIRYAPLIRERASMLTIEAQPALKELIQRSDLADRVITWGEPEPAWDQQIEVIELPRVFRTTLETIPSAVPYLKAGSTYAVAPNDLALDHIAPNHASRLLRLGVVWGSSSYNPARSIPFAYIEKLFATEGVSFCSLQAGDERRKLDPWLSRAPSRIFDSYEASEGVLATASKLKRLDLVITVDTMVAHLAGAMGKPVWTLLPFQCDWRWMLAREDSPWYPTMRLFRQPEPGDWDAVTKRVASQLETLIAHAAEPASI